MTRPPRIGAWILRLFLDRDTREIVAGDLEEAFRDDLARMPLRDARRRFRRDALASVAARWRPAPSTHPRQTGDGLMRTLLQDLRFGARVLARHPGFTATAALLLSVGIGATTAIFSVANTLLLEPLPYRDPDRVMLVLAWNLRRDEMVFSQPLVNYVAYRERAASFEALAAYQENSVNLSGGDRPERVQGYRVTTSQLPLLGVEPLLGRWFREEEGLPGGPRVVILSYGLWQRRFGGAPDIVGRSIRLDAEPHTVVGVMPPRFEFPVFNFKGDLWTPLQFSPAAVRSAAARGPWIVVTGRLRTGVTQAQAQAEMDGIASSLSAEYPAINASRGEHVTRMHEVGAAMVRPMVLVTFAAAALVLVIACANVANLTLARGLARQKEVAVRIAVGAGRFRVFRQFLTESLMLAAAGCVLGFAVARTLVTGLLSILPSMVFRTTPGIERMGLDLRVVAFAVAASLLTALAFGVVPAWQAMHAQPGEALKEGGRTTAGSGRRRLRGALVIAQIAVSLVLLVAAGLLVRTIRHLGALSPGFDASGVLAMSVTLPEARYPDAAARGVFYQRALDAVRPLPGVQSAAFVNRLPFSTTNDSTAFTIEGEPPPLPGQGPGADFRAASPAYFQALSIPVLRGRAFAEGDTADAPPVLLVNETLARRYFGDADPIGRRLRFGGADGTGPWRTIVGVVGDVKHWDLTRSAAAEIYMPLAQDPEEAMTLVIKTATPAPALAADVRQALASVDPDQPVFDITTLEALIDESLLSRRLAMQMVGLFGLAALVLAAVGLYGVIACSVAEQAHDIGVRVALGASPRHISGAVVRQGAGLAAAGIALGLAGAALVTRGLSALLYGVTAIDPATYVIGAALLAGTAVLSAWIPARRAARVDPADTLRA